MNPASLHESSTIAQLWFTTKGETVETEWKVTDQTRIPIRDFSVRAWRVTYTADSRGVWGYASQPSIGPVTETLFFEAAYGILLAIEIDGKFQYQSPAATLEETVTIRRRTTALKIQYELKVNSRFGNPQESGWYDAGSNPPFSVDSPQPTGDWLGVVGAKLIFLKWTGNSNATSPIASILMDGHKSVEAVWGTDYTQPYLIMGILIAASAVALLIKAKPQPFRRIALRRPLKSTETEMPPLQSLELPKAETPKALREQPAVASTKFCRYCGEKIPRNSIFCQS